MPAAVPAMIADWLLLTVFVETVNPALVAPPGTVTVAGTVAAAVLSLDSATAKPPAGAADVSVTVPVAVSPATTSVGATVSAESDALDAAGGGGGGDEPAGVQPDSGACVVVAPSPTEIVQVDELKEE